MRGGEEVIKGEREKIICRKEKVGEGEDGKVERKSSESA